MAALVNLRADATALQAKEQTLFACLRKLGRVIVAYSGGTDSAYLAWAAHHVLGDERRRRNSRFGVDSLLT